MNSLLIDSDVVLDLFIKREPHHGVALRFFSYIKKAKQASFFSSIALSNAYYILAKIKGAKYALDKMRKLRKLVSIALVDQGVIDAALSSPHRDFEDSIQAQCAIRNDIRTLVTRNGRDYQKDYLNIVNPHEYLIAVGLESEEG